MFRDRSFRFSFRFRLTRSILDNLHGVYPTLRVGHLHQIDLMRGHLGDLLAIEGEELTLGNVDAILAPYGMDGCGVARYSNTDGLREGRLTVVDGNLNNAHMSSSSSLIISYGDLFPSPSLRVLFM